MTPYAEKLLAKAELRRRGIVPPKPAPEAKPKPSPIRSKRGKRFPDPRLWKPGGLSHSWLRAAVTLEDFDWIDVDDSMEPANRRKKGIHTAAAGQLIQNGLLKLVVKSRLIEHPSTGKRMWSTSIYRGTAAARRLFAKLNPQ